jgi:hypothetical protein
LANLQDEATTGDDATFMSAETPTEYTIGIIDANDNDPAYIQYEAVQHLILQVVRSRLRVGRALRGQPLVLLLYLSRTAPTTLSSLMSDLTSHTLMGIPGHCSKS